MTIRRVPLASLHVAEWNPRTISDERFENLKRSLAADPRLLELRPILATADGEVYAGNMRLRAAEALGWADVPAVLEDVDDRTKRERMVRDNAQWGDWDDDGLARILSGLAADGGDAGILGFDDHELSRLLDGVRTMSEDADNAPSLDEAPTRAHAGDLWELGEHRLLCGDAANRADVARLMGTATAAILATDPPYGIDYGELVRGRKNQKAGGWADIKGDALTDDQLLALLKASLGGAGAKVAFVWHPAGARRRLFWEALEANGWRIAQEIVWVKNALVFGRADYQWRHELCIYAKREGAPRQDDRTATTVWEVAKTTDAKHPTQKPAELYVIPIRNHTQRGDIVYDPFAGSGSCVAAAEQTGRRAYLMEIDPRYCDVVLARWEALTGREAVRA